MPNVRRVNTVFRSISRPLTVLGAERKLFFFAMCIGAGTFNLLGSLGGGRLNVSAVIFCRSLGHSNRPADSTHSPHITQTSHAI